MSIILIIIGVLLGLGLFIALLKLVWNIVLFLLGVIIYLLKPALFIGALFLIYSFFGFGGIAIGIGILVILYFIGASSKDKDEQRVMKVFHTFEMTTLGDLQSQLDQAIPYDRLLELIRKFQSEGKLEEMNFGHGDKVYRWTENRRYSKGVVTKHLTVD